MDIESLSMRVKESENILSELRDLIKNKKKQVEHLSENSSVELFRSPSPSRPLSRPSSHDGPEDPPTFQYWHDSTRASRIDPDTFVDYSAHLHRYGFGRVVVVDCRSPAEYAAGHIRGAVNVYCYGHVPEGSGIDSLYDRLCDDHSSAPTLWVLHCEFSEVRAPITWRRLMQHHAAKGRARGTCHAVVLNEGFVNFFRRYRGWCVGRYLPERECMAKGNTVWYRRV